MSRSRAVLAALLLLALLVPGVEGCRRTHPNDVAARVADLERRLTTTCACHPRKIEGLPIQGRIRADLAAWIREGKGDDQILWLAFARYGSALLAAGIQDLEGEFLAAMGVVALILVSGSTVLVLHLARGRSAPG
jgi:cytochrome c-type biogenesis protein CcmH/NrfF